MKNYAAIFLLFIILISVVFTACKNSEKSSSNFESSFILHSNLSDEKNESDGKDVNTTVGKDTDNSSESVVSNTSDNNKTSEPQNDVSKIESSEPSVNSTDVPPNESKVPSNEVSSGDDSVKMLTFKEYLSLTAAEQEKYYKSFDSVQDFAEWYKKAKAEYKEEDDSIHVSGDGSFDLGEYIK